MQGFSKVVGAVCNRDPYGKSGGLSRTQSVSAPILKFQGAAVMIGSVYTASNALPGTVLS